MSGTSAWIRSISYGSLVAIMSFAAPAQNDTKLLRERTADQRPTLLVLGSGHFDNSGRHVIDIKVDDVLAETRQVEINAVVEQLASFQPTHIAVEWPLKDQAALDARYRDYRQGLYQLGRAEEEQIGLRLAAKLNHARVYAVDWNEAPTGDKPILRLGCLWQSTPESGGGGAFRSQSRNWQHSTGQAHHRDVAASDESPRDTCGESSQLLRLGKHWRR